VVEVGSGKGVRVRNMRLRASNIDGFRRMAREVASDGGGSMGGK
jgi:hypothetical protein